MYNKIYDIKNNKYISTQSNRAKNIIISYAQKGSAKDIVNIGNGVNIIFDNNNLQQELEDAKKLPGSYPSNEPYKKNLTGRPKWHDKKDNENFRLYEIKKDTIEQLLDDISQYENTKEIVKQSLNNYTSLKKHQQILEKCNNEYEKCIQELEECQEELKECQEELKECQEELKECHEELEECQ